MLFFNTLSFSSAVVMHGCENMEELKKNRLAEKAEQEKKAGQAKAEKQAARAKYIGEFGQLIKKEEAVEASAGVIAEKTGIFTKVRSVVGQTVLFAASILKALVAYTAACIIFYPVAIASMAIGFYVLTKNIFNKKDKRSLKTKFFHAINTTVTLVAVYLLIASTCIINLLGGKTDAATIVENVSCFHKLFIDIVKTVNRQTTPNNCEVETHEPCACTIEEPVQSTNADDFAETLKSNFEQVKTEIYNDLVNNDKEIVDSEKKTEEVVDTANVVSDIRMVEEMPGVTIAVEQIKKLDSDSEKKSSNDPKWLAKLKEKSNEIDTRKIVANEEELAVARTMLNQVKSMMEVHHYRPKVCSIKLHEMIEEHDRIQPNEAVRQIYREICEALMLLKTPEALRTGVRVMIGTMAPKNKISQQIQEM